MLLEVNDGVRDPRETVRSFEAGAFDEDLRHDPAIGRRPFGPFRGEAPWHGGDTAYPHAPYRWANDWWKYRDRRCGYGESADRPVSCPIESTGSSTRPTR